MRKASKAKRALSVLLSVLMMFGYVGLLSGITGLTPAANAATISVSRYDLLEDAINRANAASDVTTIQLSGNISAGEVAALPAITKNVILDLHGYNITFSYTGSVDSRDNSGEYQLPSDNQNNFTDTSGDTAPEYLSKALFNVAASGSLQIVNKSSTNATVMAHTRLQRNSTSGGTSTYYGTTSSNLIYSEGTLTLGDKANSGYNNFTLYASSSCYSEGNRKLLDYNNYHTSAFAFAVTVNGSAANLYMYGGTVNASATSRCFYNGRANARCYAMNLLNARTAEIYGGSVNIVDTSDGTGVQNVTDVDCDGNANVFSALRVATPNVYIFDLDSAVYARAGADTESARLITSNIFVTSAANAPYIYGANLSNHTTKSDSDSAAAEAYLIRGAYKIANNGQIAPSGAYGTDLEKATVDSGDNGMDYNSSRHFSTMFVFADAKTGNGVYPGGQADFRAFLASYNNSDPYFGTAQTHINDGQNYAAPTTLNYTRNGYTQDAWFGATSLYGEGDAALTSTAAAGLNAGNGGSLFLYPHWKANVYYIVFNGNGNSGGAAPARILKTYDTPITLPDGGTLVRTGRSFAGWSNVAEPGDADDKYAPLGVLTKDYIYGNSPSETGAPQITLYAMWGYDAHTITYDLNGGMLPAGVTNPTGYRGNETPRSIVINRPVRDGYAFAGWIDEETKYMTVSIVDLRLPFEGADPIDWVFTAQWVENEYVVSFDPNVAYGGYEYNENMADLVVNLSGETSLPANGYRAQTAGFKFAGWNTEPDGSGISFEDQATVTGAGLNDMEALAPLTDSDYTYRYGVTLYAQWDYLAYDISYDGNGARVPVDAQSRYDVNSDIVLPEAELEGYTFEGWEVVSRTGNRWKVGDVYSGTVEAGKIGDVSFKAKFTPTEYTITYIGEGVAENAAQGYTIESTDTLLLPEYAGYEFKGWEVQESDSDENNNWLVIPEDLEEGQTPPPTVLPADTVVTGYYGNVTLKAKWELDKYPFTANLGDGASTADAPDEVQFDEDYTFTVTFDENHDAELPAADAITAENAEITNVVYGEGTVEITFHNVTGPVTITVPTVGDLLDVTVDGEGFSASNVTADTAVRYGESFTLEVTAADGYESLTASVNGVAVAADADSTDTVYKFTVENAEAALAFTVSGEKKLYHVTFMAADGVTVLEEKDVRFEDTPAYEGADPEKDATEAYTFAFIGWDTDPDASAPAGLAAVTGDTVYYPIFSKTPVKYTITFMNEDGTETLGTEEVDYGARPEFSGATPEKAPSEEGIYYVFVGWTGTVGGTVLTTMPTVKGEATYYAVFSEANACWITFVDYDGTELLVKKFAEGVMPAYDGAEPAREDTAEYDYTFAGWTPEISVVTGDKTYTATYTAEKRSYEIKFKDKDGNVIDTQTVEYGKTPSCTAPELAADDAGHYVFSGWEPAVTAVNGAAEYTATYAFKAHKWGDPVVEEGFVCTNGGQMICTCEIGGETKLITVGPIDHAYGDWTVVKPSTFVEPGVEERVCAVCGDTEERAIPLRERDGNAGGPCPICGENHNADILDWVVGVVHQFVYFIRLITSRFSSH